MSYIAETMELAATTAGSVGVSTLLTEVPSLGFSGPYYGYEVRSMGIKIIESHLQDQEPQPDAPADDASGDGDQGNGDQSGGTPDNSGQSESQAAQIPPPISRAGGPIPSSTPTPGI